MGTNELPQACGILFSLTSRHPGIIYSAALKETKQQASTPPETNPTRKAAATFSKLQNLLPNH